MIAVITLNETTSEFNEVPLHCRNDKINYWLGEAKQRLINTINLLLK